METLTKSKKIVKNQKIESVSPVRKINKNYWKLGIAFFIFLVFGFALQKKNPLISTDQGLKLAPWRQKKLEKELKNFDKAEQYALIASVEGEYPCFSCEDGLTIHLNIGEVWKYGVTRIGKNRRYGAVMADPRLRYIIEYKGDIAECMRLEKIKIYNYALLPENTKRIIPLIRPPGNKNDS
jgi:hypothetical protein